MPFTAARTEPRKTGATHSLGFSGNCKLRVKSEVAVSWAGSKRTGGSPGLQREKSRRLGKDTQKRSAERGPEAGGGRAALGAAPGRCSPQRPLRARGRSELAPSPLARAPGRRREAAGQELGCGHLGAGPASAARSFRAAGPPPAGAPGRRSSTHSLQQAASQRRPGQKTSEPTELR